MNKEYKDEDEIEELEDEEMEKILQQERLDIYVRNITYHQIIIFFKYFVDVRVNFLKRGMIYEK